MDFIDSVQIVENNCTQVMILSVPCRKLTPQRPGFYGRASADSRLISEPVYYLKSKTRDKKNELFISSWNYALVCRFASTGSPRKTVFIVGDKQSHIQWRILMYSYMDWNNKIIQKFLEDLFDFLLDRMHLLLRLVFVYICRIRVCIACFSLNFILNYFSSHPAKFFLQFIWNSIPIMKFYSFIYSQYIICLKNILSVFFFKLRNNLILLASSSYIWH